LWSETKKRNCYRVGGYLLNSNVLNAERVIACGENAERAEYDHLQMSDITDCFVEVSC
jgi:hypothetical protein